MHRPKRPCQQRVRPHQKSFPHLFLWLSSLSGGQTPDAERLELRCRVRRTYLKRSEWAKVNGQNGQDTNYYIYNLNRRWIHHVCDVWRRRGQTVTPKGSLDPMKSARDVKDNCQAKYLITKRQIINRYIFDTTMRLPRNFPFLRICSTLLAAAFVLPMRRYLLWWILLSSISKKPTPAVPTEADVWN